MNNEKSIAVIRIQKDRYIVVELAIPDMQHMFFSLDQAVIWLHDHEYFPYTGVIEGNVYWYRWLKNRS